jgi:hypothetical protein
MEHFSARQGSKPAEYIGGVRWHRMWSVTGPSTRLSVGPGGISVEPASSRFRRLLLPAGVPEFTARWSEIETVELVSGFISLGFLLEGVSFTVNGRRLIFGCGESPAEDILEEVERWAGLELIRRRTKPKLVI